MMPRLVKSSVQNMQESKHRLNIYPLALLSSGASESSGTTRGEGKLREERGQESLLDEILNPDPSSHYNDRALYARRAGPAMPFWLWGRGAPHARATAVDTAWAGLGQLGTAGYRGGASGQCMTYSGLQILKRKSKP